MSDPSYPWQIRVRVEDVPVPAVESNKRTCEKCGAEVWSEKKTDESWLGKLGSIVCERCALEIIEAQPRP